MIPPEEIKSIGLARSRRMVPYVHPNPLIRSAFWQRLDSVVRMAPDGKKALDFGCGGGLMLPALSEKYGRVVGIDLDIADASRLVKKFNLKNVKLLKADANKCPFRKGSFDVVVSSSVLEHFKNLDRPVSEIHRILKRGGSAVIEGPTENWIYRVGRLFFGHRKPEDHYHTVREVENMLSTRLKITERRWLPLGLGSRLSLFEVILCKKEN